MTDDRKPTQKTRPKKGKPIEIPVPKRREIDELLKKAAKDPRETAENAAFRARKARERSDAAGDRQGRRDVAKPPPRQHPRRGR
jgi:hypothetical protein